MIRYLNVLPVSPSVALIVITGVPEELFSGKSLTVASFITGVNSLTSIRVMVDIPCVESCGVPLSFTVIVKV